MSPEKLARLLPLFDTVVRDFCRLAETDKLEDAFARVRRIFEEKGLDFAKWIHQEVTQMHPGCEQNALDSSSLSIIFDLLAQPGPGLCRSLLAMNPDERAPEIEQCLRYLHREGLPALRNSMNATTKLLPHEPAGGRPLATPDPDVKRVICRELADLDSKGYSRARAQKRASVNHKKSVREIQRIWQNCPQNPKNSL